MSSLKEIIDKHKWDRQKNIHHLKICYIHRGAPGNRKWITGSEVIRASGNFLVIRSRKPGETFIPFHRITMMKYEEKVIYERGGEGW